MQTFSDFLALLQSARWSPGHIDGAVLELLSELGARPDLVHQEVLTWTGEEGELRGLKSHDTATHNKWFVYYHRVNHYRVWLHQYKPPLERTLGRAEIPHNHRYSLASLVLDGGFEHRLFERQDGKLSEAPARRQIFKPGDTYQVHYDEIHMLSGLCDHTLTLVVESPAVRHFSEAFYDCSGEPRRFYDFAAMYPSLRASTARLVSM